MVDTVKWGVSIASKGSGDAKTGRLCGAAFLRRLGDRNLAPGLVVLTIPTYTALLSMLACLGTLCLQVDRLRAQLIL